MVLYGIIKVIHQLMKDLSLMALWNCGHMIILYLTPMQKNLLRGCTQYPHFWRRLRLILQAMPGTSGVAAFIE